MELIDRLEHGFRRLILALDGQDADEIIDAAAAIRPMVAEVEQAGIWRESDHLKERLVNLSKLIDASRFRVNKLTDINRQRAINLTATGGGTALSVYAKPRKNGDSPAISPG